MKKLIPVPSVTRVATSSVALIELPIGPTYESIDFVMTGTGLAATMVDTIRVLANGNELQNFKNLQQLIDINAYHGRAADTAADWALTFYNDDYIDIAEKQLERIGTLGLRTFTIEITLNATWPANGTIAAVAYVDTEQQPLGIYNRIRQAGFAAVAGLQDFDKLIRGSGIVYKQIHLIKSDVTTALLEADSIKIIDASKAQLEREQKMVRPFARVPQTAKMTTIDFVLEGDRSSLLRTDGISDLRVRMNITAGGNLDIVTEQLEIFNG